MKNWKLMATTLALSALVATPAFADTTILYNNVPLNTAMPVVNVESRTMVALRDLFESLDTRVDWDDAQRMVSLSYRDKHILMFPDTGVVQINGVSQALDVKPQFIDDRVYLPLRFLAQTLGGTVDYTQLETGDSFVEIHTMDSVENYEKAEGNVIKILRQSHNPVSTIAPNSATQAAFAEWQTHNAVYFFDNHENLIEVQSYDDKIAVNVNDYHHAKYTSTELAASQLFTPMYRVLQEERETLIFAGKPLDNRYVGVGKPSGGKASGSLQCANQVTYDVYSGTETLPAISVDMATDQATTTTVENTGFVLDVSTYSIQTSDYAIADDGTYGFMLDNQFLIMDKEASLVEEVRVGEKLSDQRVLADGNRLYGLYVSGDGLYPDLYLATYENTAGGQAHIMVRNISQLYKAPYGEKFYSYSDLDLVDALVKDDTVYALVKTDTDYYVVTYHVTTDSISKELLSIKEHTYSKVMDCGEYGVKLFGMDKDYYYLRSVK